MRLASALSVPMSLLAALTVPAAAPPERSLAERTHAVLVRHCAACHGGEGSGKAKGGLSYILDRDRLVHQGQVVPGRLDESPLYQRVADGEMPPPAARRSFTKADQELIARWITAGAPGLGASPPVRRLSGPELLRHLHDDLLTVPARQRRFQRYLILPHLAGRPSERKALTQALSLLVNSLSWHPRLTPPRSLADGLAYRIDLRDYRWSARSWDRLAARHPYQSREPDERERELARLTGSERPVLRGDWFLATASRPPHYQDLLALPATDRALERLLQVDVPTNLEEQRVVRAGFNGSGVARFNRTIERHDAAHGAYWRSYDFSDSTGKQNLFEHPLGPTPGPVGFRHVGGEVIFHLPNGLQGYLLVDADGRRVDRAPGEIVSDPRRPDRLVETGVSCFGCHAWGILPKDDQIRAHVLKNPRAFTADQRDDILALYAPARTMRALVKEDNERYGAALKRLGVPVGEGTPILDAVLRYEEVLDRERAAEELGITTTQLGDVLERSAELARSLGPLLARGGVQRALFEESYPRLVELLPTTAAVIRPAAGRYRGHRVAVRCLAWAPDGKRFVSADEDGRILVWDLTTGSPRELGRHADEVRALALSPDGRRLLSAGGDRSVVLWDVANGQRLARWLGHTASVRAVAFSADGRTAVSAGEDRTVRVWDVEGGKQRLALTGHGGTVTTLAISPDGRFALSGATDRTARLWDLKSGKEITSYPHTGEVHAVAFSGDGRRLLAGGGDRTVVVRDRATGTVLRRLAGLAGTVIALAADRTGAALVAVAATTEAAPVLWSVPGRHASGEKLLPRVQQAGKGPVAAAATAPDGRVLLVADRDIELLDRPW